MGKRIEITQRVQHDYTGIRYFGYDTTIKIDKKRSISFSNEIDCKPETDMDNVWQFYIHAHGLKFKVKGEDGIVADKEVYDLDSTKTIHERNKLTLGFKPPKLENGRFDDEMALEYMLAIAECFDVKKRQFDMGKAMNISKQFTERAEKVNDMTNENKKHLTKTSQKENVKVAEEVAERN